MIVRLQTEEVAIILRLVRKRKNDCLDKLLGTFYEVLVDGAHRTISAIDITEIMKDGDKNNEC